VLLLLAAAATVVAAALLAKHVRQTRAAARAAYACPMHPEITTRAPGACPICGMALERHEPRADPLADVTDVAIASDGGRSVTLPIALAHGHHPGLKLGPLELEAQELEAPAVVSDQGDVIARLYPDEAATLAPDAAAAFLPGRVGAPSVAVRLDAARPSR